MHMEVIERFSMEGMQLHVRNAAVVALRPLLFARVRCSCLFKKILDNLLLGFFEVLDRSLGAMYTVLDVGFEGVEAYKTKDIILPHKLSPSSTPSAGSSTPRTSNEFGVEDNIVIHACNASIDYDLKMLPSSQGNDLRNNNHNSKPRRAGIIAERQQNAKNLSSTCSERYSCTCWGWEVQEGSLDKQISIHNTQEEFLDDNDNAFNFSESSTSTSACYDMTVRWSECQCLECRKLWMPMSKARSRLHVQTCNRNNISDLELNPSTRNSYNNASRNSFDQSAPAVARSKEVPQKSADGRIQSLLRSVSGSLNPNRTKSRQKSLVPATSGNSSSEAGEKTGIIFLHGIFSSSDFWFDSNIVPHLDGSIKSRHLILAPDLLGCGRSPRPFDSLYTLSDQIEALENSLLKKHKLDSFHIVAHSMGTIPALALAARFPNRVRSLSLIAPVYAGYTDPNLGGEEILTDCNSILAFEDPWSARALRSLTASQHYNINRFLGHLLFSRHQLLVPICQRLLQNMWPRSFVRDYLAVTHDAAWHIVHNTMIGGSHALVPALRKLKDRGKRVFVIHGTDDTSCPFEQTVLMAQHFQNVVLVPAPGKGHVDVVLGRHDEVLPFVEKEILLGDANFVYGVGDQPS